MSSAALAYASQIVASVEWIEQLLLGPVATAVAIISVAAVGVAMLSGRASWRRGVSVVAGCFIVFGAAPIARGLAEPSSGATMPELAASPTIAPIARPAASAAYDPYAGAGLVVRPASKESLRAQRSDGLSRPLPTGQNSRLDAPTTIR